MLTKAFPTILGAVSGATAYAASFTTTKDTYIYSGSGGNDNFGTSVYLQVGTDAVSDKYRSLLHFDLTSIPGSPTPVTITSAMLTLWSAGSIYDTSTTTPVTGKVRKMLRTTWSESQATWLEYSTGNAWGTSGADNSTTDHVTTNQTSWSKGGTGVMNVDITALVQDAIDNASEQLHLLMVGDIENDDLKRVTFFSANYTDATKVPTLTVNYTLGSGTAAASAPIRLMAVCNSLNSEGTATFTDEYSGAALSASWNHVATLLDGQTSTALPDVASGYATSNLASTSANLRLAFLATQSASTAALREVTLGLDAYPTNVGLPTPSYAYVFMDQATSPNPLTGGFYVRADATSSGYLTNLYVNGSLVTQSSVVPLVSAPTALRVTIDAAETIRVYLTNATTPDITYAQSSYTPAGDRVGFAMRRNVGGVDGGAVRSNFFRFQYISSLGGDPKDMLMASANGMLYKQTLLNTMTQVVSTVTLATDRMLVAARRLQKLYIADYGILRSATGATSSTTTFTDTAVANFSTDVAGLTAGDYLRITNATGVTVGDYRITVVSTGSTLTLATSPGTTGSDIVYKILRGPKVYDSETNQLTAMTPLATAVPPGCTIVEAWMDRLVWGGDPDFQHRMYMSGVGDPTDYDYSLTGTYGAAVPFSAAKSTAEVGDRVRAIGSHRDDYLIIGGQRNSFIARGDPNQNDSQLDAISKLGVLDKRSWCQTPDGYWIAMTTDGLYRIPPASDAVPQAMSRPRLPLELKGISTLLYDIQCDYDQDYNGVHVFMSPVSVGATTHWFYDLETDAFEPASFASDHDPTASCEHALAGETPTVFIGCRDGYIRRFSDTATTDDGVSMLSYIDIGPVMTAPGGFDGMLNFVAPELAASSGTVRLYVRTGRTAESASTATRQELTESGLPLVVDSNRTYWPQRWGRAAIITLESTGRWAWEQLVIGRTTLKGP